jgi:hypothetical protein
VDVEANFQAAGVLGCSVGLQLIIRFLFRVKMDDALLNGEHAIV